MQHVHVQLHRFKLNSPECKGKHDNHQQETSSEKLAMVELRRPLQNL